MTSNRFLTSLIVISGDTFDSKNPDWMTFRFDLPKGNLSIKLFSDGILLDQPYSAAIDEILVTEGECPTEG